MQFTMADRKINAVMSTSAGRLFDGVSAILGICSKSTFEGEASMALEFAAEGYKETLPEKSKQRILESDRLLLNTESLIKEIMNRLFKW